MQSTGQTGMHSSQPVQSASITVCMRLAAPTIASTGQALRHSVQPMHQASSITASARGAFDAACRVERQRRRGRSSARQARDAFGAAGRAAVDRRPRRRRWPRRSRGSRGSRSGVHCVCGSASSSARGAGGSAAWPRHADRRCAAGVPLGAASGAVAAARLRGRPGRAPPSLVRGDEVAHLADRPSRASGGRRRCRSGRRRSTS